jgi:aminoglycoside phosphotransferase (APT) family kinase protein
VDAPRHRNGTPASRSRGLDRANRLVRSWSTDHRMVDALAVLPSALVHGDVHAGNVLISPDSAVLIDWGNARIGPAMLDVANCAPPGSANHDAYLRAWAESTGAPLNPMTAAVGSPWASVHVNVQYLGWAAQHLAPSRVETCLIRPKRHSRSSGTRYTLDRHKRTTATTTPGIPTARTITRRTNRC